MFWKVLVYRPDGQELRGRGFLITQSLKGLRVASPLDEFATYEVTLIDLAQRSGLSFDDTLMAAGATADLGQLGPLDAGPRPVGTLAAIRW